MAVSPLAGFNNLSIPSSKQQSKFAGQSVRAIPIRVLTVGKKRSQGVQLIVDEYMKKLKHYCSVEDVRIKSNPRNARDVVAQIEHEDMAVMGHIRPDEWEYLLSLGCSEAFSFLLKLLISSYFFHASTLINFLVVMLDERGHDVGSEQMASLIGDAGNKGASSLLFCIGGPYGHGRQLRQRANISVKLSSLVLNHEIAVVVLIEQLYRAWTILKGQNYHH